MNVLVQGNVLHPYAENGALVLSACSRHLLYLLFLGLLCMYLNLKISLPDLAGINPLFLNVCIDDCFDWLGCGFCHVINFFYDKRNLSQ